MFWLPTMISCCCLLLPTVLFTICAVSSPSPIPLTMKTFGRASESGRRANRQSSTHLSRSFVSEAVVQGPA